MAYTREFERLRSLTESLGYSISYNKSSESSKKSDIIFIPNTWSNRSAFKQLASSPNLYLLRNRCKLGIFIIGYINKEILNSFIKCIHNNIDECNICWESRPTIKCSACTYQQCTTCIMKIRDKKCPQCRITINTETILGPVMRDRYGIHIESLPDLLRYDSVMNYLNISRYILRAQNYCLILKSGVSRCCDCMGRNNITHITPTIWICRTCQDKPISGSNGVAFKGSISNLF
jgi:hypothetical protein